MLTIISPSKSQDFNSLPPISDYTLPYFTEEVKELVNNLQKLKKEELTKLMNISSKIAELNFTRYKIFSSSPNLTNSKQAIFAYTGDVYTKLKALEFNIEDLNFSQNHLAIVSGLYGLLKPLDLIQAYRLEMNIKLKNYKGTNLYQFWGNKITDLINNIIATHDNKTIINLASKEYFTAINTKLLNADIVNINFKEFRKDNYITIALLAKKARGLMTKYIIKNKINDLASLKDFSEENYRFNHKLSKPNELVFTRE